MAGGANVSYWGQRTDGCEGEESACPCVAGNGDKSCPGSYPGAPLEKGWVAGLRQGPPGEVSSCADHGVVRMSCANLCILLTNKVAAEIVSAPVTIPAAIHPFQTSLYADR